MARAQAASPRVWVLPATAAAVWVALLVSAGILDLRFAMTVLLWHAATIAGVTTLCASSLVTLAVGAGPLNEKKEGLIARCET